MARNLSDVINSAGSLVAILREARREIDSLPDLGGRGGSGAQGPRGANAGDIRQLGGKLDQIGRKLDRMGSRRADPFIRDLLRSGPRRA